MLRSLIACVTALDLLTSCGGGTSQIEPFKPARVLVFGDETSLITPQGLKYSINEYGSDGATLDCKLSPVWVQILAGIYGYGFEQCPVGTGEQKAKSWAQAGARAADLVQQVDAQAAAGGFTTSDLVTVLVGSHDVLDLYLQYPAKSEAEVLALARQRGELIAAQVNRMVNLGAKVIVSTIPDMGLSPYAAAQGPAAAALLSSMSLALNGRIRVNIINDGRYVGLVLADEFVQTASKASFLFGLSDVTTSACTVSLPDCTNKTLSRTDYLPLAWLWADDRRLGTGGHRQLGVLAESRARYNPF